MTSRLLGMPSGLRVPVAAVLASLLAAPPAALAQIPPERAAQAGKANGVSVKYANPQAVRALHDAVLDFDEQGRRNNGKAPANARASVQKMRAAANAAKAEIRALAARLKREGKVEAFNRMAEESATRAGASAVLAELRSAGGAHAMLERADAYIDEMLETRRKVAEGQGTARLIESLLGVATVHAGLKTGTCAAFWFVISLGYGTAHAYRSCYY